MPKTARSMFPVTVASIIFIFLNRKMVTLFINVACFDWVEICFDVMLITHKKSWNILKTYWPSDLCLMPIWIPGAHIIKIKHYILLCFLNSVAQQITSCLGAWKGASDPWVLKPKNWGTNLVGSFSQAPFVTTPSLIGCHDISWSVVKRLNCCVYDQGHNEDSKDYSVLVSPIHIYFYMTLISLEAS